MCALALCLSRTFAVVAADNGSIDLNAEVGLYTDLNQRSHSALVVTEGDGKAIEMQECVRERDVSRESSLSYCRFPDIS